MPQRPIIDVHRGTTDLRARSAVIRGKVVDQGSPMPGVVLTLRAANSPTADVLDQTSTDRRGQFELLVADTEFGTRAGAAAGRRTRAAFVEVTSAGGESLVPLRQVVLTPSGSLTIEVPTRSGRVDAQTWQGVAAVMEESRLVRMNDVVRQLLNPGADGAFAKLGAATRYQVLSELEREFVDPTGQLRANRLPTTLAALADDDTFLAAAETVAGNAVALAELTNARARSQVFDRFSAVDWVVDTATLADAQPAKAMGKYSDVYTVSLSNSDMVLTESQTFSELVKVYPPSDLSRYRDYLLTVYTGSQSSDAFTDRRAKLRTRFHQQFSGTDIGSRPANEILHGIVRKILTAPKGAEYGFGLAASALPSQGDLSDREYLDQLLALSGITRTEFGLRYRLGLDRPDSVDSSVVQEQINTLQAFYNDGFRSMADPFPVIPEKLREKPPFYLYFTEWARRSGAFHAENFFQPERCVGLEMPDNIREALLALDEDEESDIELKWFVPLVKAEDRFAEGLKRARLQQYAMATEAYASAESLLLRALARLPTEGDVNATFGVINDSLEYWAELALENPQDLDEFMDYVLPAPMPDDATVPYEGQAWLSDWRDRAQLLLCHFAFVVLPTAQGDIALAQGDFAEATARYEVVTRFLVGRANEATPTGWKDEAWGEHVSVPAAEADSGGASSVVRGGRDPLPYTTAGRPADPIRSDLWSAYVRNLTILFLKKMNPMERRFARLRHAEALLGWADALYASEEASSIQRARELYKAALLLHEADVAISPLWLTKPTLAYRMHDPNPAWVSQTARARSGLQQIDHGLNWHGLTDDAIPILRYQTLKQAADRFAAAAYSAQADFLAYLGKVEDALKDEILHNNMLKRARLQGQLAGEQAKLASTALDMANRQVAEVKKAIADKRKEIEDNSGFFDQFVGFIGGMVTAISDLPSGATGAVKDEGKSQVSAEASGLAFTGAAGGATAMAGYGLFIYAGYTSLNKLDEETNTLQGQLNALEDKALPLAQQQVSVRKTELTIAHLQGQIAEADAQLALDLMHFQSVRFLNAELWSQLAGVVRRLMRRYLALGARFAWLAERAVAFEQHRELDIIRLDYFPRKLQGLSGADLLRADLAELETTRLDGVRQMVPIRRTYSLQFDFPVQFAALRATGRCSFGTNELTLRREHPGTYGHRIAGVTASFGTATGLPPVRGLLTNLGVSAVSSEDGVQTTVVRSPESLPLSEPAPVAASVDGEALGTFEGTGVETQWVLEVPPAANPAGLDALADVQLTLDVRAHHSAQLRAADLATMPTTIRRFVFVSLAGQDPAAFAELRDAAGPVTFTTGLGVDQISSWHSDATLHNVAVLVAAPQPPSLHAQLSATGTAVSVPVDVQSGIAVSNLPPLTTDPPAPASPLNGFAGLPADQPCTLTIDPASNPGVDLATIKDIVVGFEYEAGLPDGT